MSCAEIVSVSVRRSIVIADSNGIDKDNMMKEMGDNVGKDMIEVIQGRVVALELYKQLRNSMIDYYKHSNSRALSLQHELQMLESDNS